jgi:serine/threonine protein kinase
MNDVKVARTWGIVELTPNSEYMLVTEFFEDSKDLGDSEIDDAVIDQGLGLIRRFWDIGVAHRDVKPANLLVQRGRLQLVDVSGLEVRPSPWRQAVDLANMMLTLALQTDPVRVYARATEVFTPDEIAEAFASAQGMAVPTQLSARLKVDTRPIVSSFIELAPAHPPVSIQRWSLQRVALTVGAVVGGLILIAMAIDSLFAGLR